MNMIDNSQRTAAKVAGWSGLLTFAIVVFGNYMLLNPLVVPGDAVATAQNIVAHQTQVRITVVCFLTYSLGVIVFLTALYVILKPINPGLALIGALFRLVFALLWLLAPLNLLGALRLLSNANYLKSLNRIDCRHWPDYISAEFRCLLCGPAFLRIGGDSLRLAVAQVELHSERIVDLRRDLLSVVCALRFHLPHFSGLQQNRERLHLRFSDGSVRTRP